MLFPIPSALRATRSAGGMRTRRPYCTSNFGLIAVYYQSRLMSVKRTNISLSIYAPEGGVRTRHTAHTQVGRPTHETPTREYTHKHTQTHTNTHFTLYHGLGRSRPSPVIAEGATLVATLEVAALVEDEAAEAYLILSQKGWHRAPGSNKEGGHSSPWPGRQLFEGDAVEGGARKAAQPAVAHRAALRLRHPLHPRVHLGLHAREAPA